MKKFSTLVELLSHRASIQPQKLAYTFLSDGEKKELNLTHADLEMKVKAIAAQLQSLNLTGERALLLYPPSLEYIIAFFGCLYAGVIAVPSYPPRPNRSFSRLLAVIQDAKAKITLTTASVLSKIEKKVTEIPELKTLNWLTTDTIINNDLAEKWQYPHINSNSLAFLQYTSGSTGSPKGVMVSHQNLLDNSDIIYNAFEHRDNSSVSWLPMYHDMGLIGGILQPIYGGFPVTLMSPFSFLQKPRRWLEAISKYQATSSGGPNFAYDLCVDKITLEQKANLDLSSWEVAFNGSEKVRYETLERFATAFKSCGFRATAFYPCYGMAEATLFVSGGLKSQIPNVISVDSNALKNNQVIINYSEQTNNQKIVSCGHSWLDIEIIIVNSETLQECAENQIGEIWVNGKSITQGYWQQPKLTQQTFQASLTEKEDKTFLRTGDLGFLYNGELYVTGRLKDLIIIDGQNHYPQDIELTVETSHSAIIPNSCAAISLDINGEEKLAVLAEINRHYQGESKEILKSIRTNIATVHEINVEEIKLLKQGTIPKTSSGKIQHFKCSELIQN